jgi:hypothetical protein
MITITATCSESLRSDSNQLAMVLAFSEADSFTYQEPRWHRGDTAYSAASFPVRPEWIQGAQSPLTRPEWDTEEIIDMAAANRAQAALVFWMPEYNEEGQLVTPPPQAEPDKLTAIGGPEGLAALKMMGLSDGLPEDTTEPTEPEM